MKDPQDIYVAPGWLRTLSVVVVTLMIAFVVLCSLVFSNALQISHVYYLFVDPPDWGYFFWVLVLFLLLVSTTAVATFNVSWPPKTYHYLMIVCVLNALVAATFSFGTKISLFFSFLFTIGLTVCTFYLWILQQNPTNLAFSHSLFARIVHSLYFGWALMSSFWLFGVVCVYMIGISQVAYTYVFFIGVVFSFLGLTALVRKREYNYSLKAWSGAGLAVLWGVIGALMTATSRKNKF